VYRDVIVVRSEAGGEVRLPVCARAPAPRVFLGETDADALDFGTVPAGSIVARELSVRNDSELRGALVGVRDETDSHAEAAERLGERGEQLRGTLGELRTALATQASHADELDRRVAALSEWVAAHAGEVVVGGAQALTLGTGGAGRGSARHAPRRPATASASSSSTSG
jgi:hypothetical protein